MLNKAANSLFIQVLLFLRAGGKNNNLGVEYASRAH